MFSLDCLELRGIWGGTIVYLFSLFFLFPSNASGKSGCMSLEALDNSVNRVETILFFEEAAR
ncbi:MAG: hypothetical protein CSA33_08225 [Desulfobulbus propionicus]|nr:MAG: hypothetical protein CSA33_08225 [Desulfobulbus propionicus]